MEILSYVLEGALAHKDSAGGGGVIRPGEIQFMRAGSGVQHSEQNHSKVDPVHFLQIWIVPDTPGLRPTYGQKVLDRDAAKRSFVLLASKDGREGTIQVQQDANVWMALIDEGERRDLPLAPGRHAWIHVARGSVSLSGTDLREGDGAAVSDENRLRFLGQHATEVLVFDLA
jgi:redox-sensitive bicupin YhaK (pirin superfamily)